MAGSDARERIFLDRDLSSEIAAWLLALFLASLRRRFIADLILGMKKSFWFQKCSDNLAQAPGAVNRLDARAVCPDSDTGEPFLPGPTPSSGRGHVKKAAAFLGLMTLTSRILGMIRDIWSAQRFGAAWQWDAFSYAFMIPNFFRRLAADGVISSAIIPPYVEILEKRGQEQAWAFAKALFGVTLTACGLALLLAEIFLSGGIASGIAGAKASLILESLRLLSPYLFFFVLFSLSSAILNAHRHFSLPSLGPAILDLGWIAGLAWISFRRGSLTVESELKLLAAALLAAGAVQAALNMAALRRLGFRFRWRLEWTAPLAKIIWSFPGVMLGLGVLQINLLIDGTFALFCPSGANSSLWYASQLLYFPLGIVAGSLATVSLPILSSEVSAGDFTRAEATLGSFLRHLFFFLIPAGMGLASLGIPIVSLLFERGAFDTFATGRTASVLAAYGFGLAAFGAQRITANLFYAAGDHSTPTRLAAAAVIAKVVMSLVLVGGFQESGLAAATSLAGFLHLGLLLIFIRRKVFKLSLRSLGRGLGRMLAAALIMGAAARIFFGRFQVLFSPGYPGTGFLPLLGAVSLAGVFYFFLCFLLRVPEARELWRKISSPRLRKAS